MAKRIGPRYRKIETDLWAQSPFRKVSQESQFLYLYLRTGPHTTNIPGLWRLGPGGLVDGLSWQATKVKRRFGELEAAGLCRADWTAAVVLVPGAFRADPPANPDAIRGWQMAWSEIPDCELKKRFWHLAERHCEQRGENFVAALPRCDDGAGSLGRSHDAGHGVPQGAPHRVPHQEQEQEQEQEQTVAPAALHPPPRRGRRKRGGGFKQVGDVADSVAKVPGDVKAVRRVIRDLYEQNEHRYGYEGGQTDLKEDTKRQLARAHIEANPDTLRKALDAEEYTESRGLRKSSHGSRRSRTRREAPP